MTQDGNEIYAADIGSYEYFICCQGTGGNNLLFSEQEVHPCVYYSCVLHKAAHQGMMKCERCIFSLSLVSSYWW